MNVDNLLWRALMEFRLSDGHCLEDDWIVYREDMTFSVSPTCPSDEDVMAMLSTQRMDIAGMEIEELFTGQLYYYYSLELNLDAIMALKLYWPLIYSSKRSDSTLPFVIIHMAQSLDGKICTSSGSSKWIGNQENLTHAHRLRACVDGILVGGNTLLEDMPKLNVRHVDGPNPVRLFLTNTFNRFCKLPDVPGSKTFLLRKHDRVRKIPDFDKIDQTITYGDTPNPLKDLLLQLKGQGIRSILIEGGPTTVSSFWQSGCVDWAQIHIAPIVLGGGKSFIHLSGIDKVSDGSSLSNVFYTQMGEAMMITGACTHSTCSRPTRKTIHESEGTLA